MPPMVVLGAMIQCSGAPMMPPVPFAPSPKPFLCTNLPAATVMDCAPMVNIPTFGMCMLPANPAVAAATTAASGVLTPAPCVPVTPSPWAPGAFKVKLAGMPALLQTDMCMCTWGGQIRVVQPGQFLVQAT